MGYLDNAGLSKYTAKIKALLNGFVPSSRTINGKALSSNITLTAANVSARPSSWTPTAAEVGALPISGGTLTGDLIIKGSGNYGTKINLGDGDYVHFSEPTDDCLEIKAKKVNFVLSDTTDTKFTINGANPFAAASSGGSSSVEIITYKGTDVSSQTLNLKWSTNKTPIACSIQGGETVANKADKPHLFIGSFAIPSSLLNSTFYVQTINCSETSTALAKLSVLVNPSTKTLTFGTGFTYADYADATYYCILYFS